MESVLVVETRLLSKYILGKTGLISDESGGLLDTIINRHEFIPRPLAEEDPSYKQIIPYVVLRQGGKVFYTRRLNKGTEARLHGKISVGIGGHINPLDEQDKQKVLICGLERELDEEVDIASRGELLPLGFINDDTNGVGSVHLGLCYTLEVSGPVSVRETEKLTGGWMSLPELEANYDNMETWSQIAFSALK